MDIEEVGFLIVNSAIKVHRTLGPGLLEAVYQKCLSYELETQGLRIASEVPIPVRYESITVDVGFRADILVEQKVIIENKAVGGISPIHEAQLLTYLKITGMRLGYLLNWNVALMKDGIKRMVNHL
jgi:GxxExxY protein